MRVTTCKCGQKMRVPPELMGKTSKCVRCGAELTINESTTQPSEADAAQPSPELPTESCKLVGQLLVEDGAITEEQLQQGLTLQGERGSKICETLVSLGHLGKDALHDFMSRQTGVASIDLKNCDIPSELVELVPKGFALANQVFPIDKLGRLLTVGMAVPLDKATVTELERMTGLRVKPMLCHIDDILQTVERYYPGERRPMATWDGALPSRPAAPRKAALSREDVSGRLVRLESLPPLPKSVESFVATLENPKSTIRDAVASSMTDPAILAAMLATANAEGYGLPGRIANAAGAAALLGLLGMRQVVANMHVTAEPTKGFDHKAFVSRSLFCAMAAETIAKGVDEGIASTAYAAGLLHRIGAIALAATFPDTYPATAEMAENAQLVAAENDTLGITYPEAGYLLAQAWRLPAALAEPIRYHLEPDSASEHGDLSAIVALAASMSEAFGAQRVQDASPLHASPELLATLGLDDAAAIQILRSTASRFNGAAS